MRAAGLVACFVFSTACTTANPNLLGGTDQGSGNADLAVAMTNDAAGQGSGDAAGLPLDGAAIGEDAGSDPVPADLGSAANDAASAPPDASSPLPDLVGSAPDLAGGPVTVGKFVINAFAAPQNPGDYAIDLNGDNAKDDWLGTLNQQLKMYGLPSTINGLNASIVNNGDPLHLLQLTPAGTTTTASATTIARLGVPTPGPKLDGTGVFVVDNAVAPSTFIGPIDNARFTALPPSSVVGPVTMRVKVPVLDSFVAIDLVATHITFKQMGTGLIEGRLRGAIREVDMQSKLLPVAAARLNANANAGVYRTFFDNGGADEDCGAEAKYCKNFDGTCGVPKNGVIEPCEVRSQNFSQNLFKPDVDLFAADGVTYQPSAANQNRDSYSLGLAFTAVRASF